ncbi:MAG: hypothetical protein GY838_01400 [bacterium]|nr:hypothetical protein [bacterium]
MTRVRPLALVVLAALAMTIGAAVAQTQDFTPDCTVGNLNQPALFAPNIFTGEEAFAYLIEPSGLCQFEGGHFSLMNVTQLLSFEDQQLPATLQVEAAIMEARWDDSFGCLLPGETLHASIPVTRRVETVGIFGVTVELDPLILPLDEPYFLSLRYMGGSPASLVTDDLPLPCVEFIDRGQGWEDLFTFDKNGDGKAIVFGDVVYATSTVPESDSTWGAVKSLYR